MPLSDAEKKAYGRGYNTRANQWPAHRPPHPPNEQIKAFYEAARALRDEADSICATLLEDDDLVKRLGPLIDEIDLEFISLSNFLRSADPPERKP